MWGTIILRRTGMSDSLKQTMSFYFKGGAARGNTGNPAPMPHSPIKNSTNEPKTKLFPDNPKLNLIAKHTEPKAMVPRLSEELPTKEGWESLLAKEEKTQAEFVYVNATQIKYRPASTINQTGAVIPASMAMPTWDALAALSQKVGDIDDWVCDALRWSKNDLLKYLTSEQVDGVALALNAAMTGKGLIIADATGFGKGRTLAAAARGARFLGKKVIFLTEKANLFSDFWRDIRDIDSENIFGIPFVMNNGAKIVNTYSVESEVLVQSGKKTEIDRIVKTGILPEDTYLVMATYSQFNRRKTIKNDFLEKISEGAYLILDESHNFVGDSNTRKMVGEAVRMASGTLFSSATYARDISDLAAYTSVFPWLGKLSERQDITQRHRRAIAEESVAMATKAGRIIRREHDLTHMRLVIRRAHDEKIEENKSLSDALAPILSEMAKLSRWANAIIMQKNEKTKQLLENISSPEERKKKRELYSVVNYGAKLNALLGQFLIAISIKPCVEVCVEALLNGEKPVVVIESTMEAMMRDILNDEFDDQNAKDNEDTEDGDDSLLPDQQIPTEPPSFKNALSLMANRLIRVSRRYGEKWTKEIKTLEEPRLIELQTRIINMISGFPDLSLSPIDDIRDAVEREGARLFESKRIPAPWKTDEISARSLRVVDGNYVAMPKADRNKVVAQFVNGRAHMLVLTQAAAAGLSIHDSEKFSDHGCRHMIELSPPRNVLARIQTWGRVWRRGQLTTPKFTVLDTGLPFHTYDLAARNRKLIDLSASVSGTTKTTVSLDLPDPMDRTGNEVAHDILTERHALAETMGINVNIDKEEAEDANYFVGRLFRRLPLLSSALQEQVCSTFYAIYNDRAQITQESKTSHNLDGEWKIINREILDPGDGSKNHFTGEDVLVTTIATEIPRHPIRSHDVIEAIKDGRQKYKENQNLQRQRERIKAITPKLLEAALSKRQFPDVRQALLSDEDNPVKKVNHKLKLIDRILNKITPGSIVDLPHDENVVAKGIITKMDGPNIERSHLPREYKIHYAIPGDEAIRTVSLDAIIRDPRIKPYEDTELESILDEFDAAEGGMVTVTRKILDGNKIGAIMASLRLGGGTRTVFKDERGIVRSGILIPKNLEQKLPTQLCRTNKPKIVMEIMKNGGKIETNPGVPAENIVFLSNRIDRMKIVIPNNRRLIKEMETTALTNLVGHFNQSWRGREASTLMVNGEKIITYFVSKGVEFFFEPRYRGLLVTLSNGDFRH